MANKGILLILAGLGAAAAAIAVVGRGGAVPPTPPPPPPPPPPNQPPVASFVISGPISPQAGQAVGFDASGSSDPDGTILAYAWDFGDGSTGEGVTTTHTYSDAGDYPVRLTVTDDGGLTDTLTQTVTMYGGPPPPPPPAGPPWDIILMYGRPASTIRVVGDSFDQTWYDLDPNAMELRFVFLTSGYIREIYIDGQTPTHVSWPDGTGFPVRVDETTAGTYGVPIVVIW